MNYEWKHWKWTHKNRRLACVCLSTFQILISCMCSERRVLLFLLARVIKKIVLFSMENIDCLYAAHYPLTFKAFAKCSTFFQWKKKWNATQINQVRSRCLRSNEKWASERIYALLRLVENNIIFFVNIWKDWTCRGSANFILGLHLSRQYLHEIAFHLLDIKRRYLLNIIKA